MPPKQPIAIRKGPAPNRASHNSLEVARLLQEGFELHRQGRITDAKATYERILLKEKNNFYANHLLGAVYAQQKEYAIALTFFEKALHIKSNSAETHYNKGVTLQNLKKFSDALISYDEALRINPDYAAAYYNRGNTLQDLSRFDEALRSYDEAIRLNPDYAEAHNNRGTLLKKLKRLDEAIKSYDEVLRINPYDAEAHYIRANTLRELKRFAYALISYDEALRINPDYAAAYYNRGNTLQDLSRFDEALRSYDEAIRLNPDYAEAHNNRGVTLNELDRLDEALRSYDEALRIKPYDPEAHYNRGNTLRELKRFAYALISYNEALRNKPHYFNACYNRALLNLMIKNFTEGFLDYRHRWKTQGFPSKPLRTTLPSLAQTRVEGRLLLWAEQGIGDEIFYASLLPLILKRDVFITMSSDKRLHAIYKRSFPTVETVDKDILSESSVDTGFDFQAPIGDLGYLLNIDELAIRESRFPYFSSDSTKRLDLRKRLKCDGSELICGIAWKSSNKQLGAHKSIDLLSLETLLCLPGIRFVNLQYGSVEGDIEKVKSKFSVDIQQVPDIDIFNDLDGLLALIDACDLVVTTSNVTAHLAGSIGKRAGVLVPYGKGRFWYWHHDDQNSLWYPSTRLFYQDDRLTWDNAIADCSNWVRSLLQGI